MTFKVFTAAFAVMAVLATAASIATGPTSILSTVSAGAAGIFAGLALIVARFWWLDCRDERRHQAEMRQIADQIRRITDPDHEPEATP